LRLRGGSWAIEILPARGGRIRSLKHDGVELLDQGIGIDEPGASGFVEAGAFGWDELVPTVDATESLPDHGEAWRMPWKVEASSESACSMSCSGRVAPWGLRRDLRLDGAVRVEYTLTNLGPSGAMPGYWCAHPLFRYEDGMEIEIAGARLMSFAQGKSGKFFLPRGETDRARVRWASGLGVEVRWDASVAQYCGVWICNGDLGGYRQVAIEPATGGGDRPDSDEPPPQLGPGESLRWWLEVRSL